MPGTALGPGDTVVTRTDTPLAWNARSGKGSWATVSVHKWSPADPDSVSWIPCSVMAVEGTHGLSLELDMVMDRGG